ncbi:probable cytochrome P450 6a20 [Episyrphus balteatus]|uniref:probable cytochrome P450 6a20 n=1 Tax=Episyrphus balteatus TaxID=286459 RepID=UPI002485FB3B|nr:probable cytochrome P450 6a20 [Episyrphus balteatus]
MDLWIFIINVFLFSLSVAYLFVKRRFSYWNRREIPHDKPCFPGGNVKPNCHINESIRQNYFKFKETGPFGGFFMNLQPAVVVYDLDLIKNILVKDFHNFTERGLFHNEKDDPLSGNLFRLDETKWKHFRSQLSPSFSGIRMKDMFLTIVSIGQNLVETFDDIVDVPSTVVEMNEIIARYVTDVNGNCVFGLDCNSLNDKNADFFRTVKDMPGLKLHSKLVSILISSFPKLAQKLRMRITHEDLHNFFLRIVRETIKYREKNSVKRNDFLNLMIELKNIDADLSLGKIAGQTFAYFFAGYENSTAAIGLTLYELALNEDIQDKLRAEIVNRMEKHRQRLTFECMMEMKYLKKVVKESLRKYPIVPFLLRLAKNDYPTSDPKYTIPKGTIVIIPTDAIQNDPDVYVDSEQFDPERFRPEEVQLRNTTTWLPFGEGPRHCIGLRFAKMQIYVALILLLKNYKFYSCLKTKNPVEWDPKKKVLGAKDGIFLHVEHI